MNALTDDLAWRLGWMLIHSVWQLALIGSLVALVLTMLSRCSANLRYQVACVGLASMYLPLACTFLLIPARPIDERPVDTSTFPTPASLLPRTGDSVHRPLAAPVTAEWTGSDAGPVEREGIPNESPAIVPFATEPQFEDTQPVEEASRLLPDLSLWLPTLVPVWIAGVGVLAIWNVGGLFVVYRLRSRATVLSIETVGRRLEELALRMGIRRPVVLAESMLVEVPTVIGCFRPVILLPASLITGLSPVQLDAILAHELAHIRRYDFLINLLQSLTESLMFYHPAVWLLSRRIRIEREFCCDDAAIEACGDRKGYAQALVAVEDGRAVPAPALSFLGSGRGFTLDRVRRIMGVSGPATHRWLAASCAIAVALLIGFGAAFARNTDEHDVAGTEQTEPDVEQRLQQENETNRTDSFDPKSFQLDLVYRGPSDKPFYDVSLRTGRITEKPREFSIIKQLDEFRALRIFAWLKRSGFFEHAREENSEPLNRLDEQRYILRVTSGNQTLEEDLGWDPGLDLRLASLCRVFEEQPLTSKISAQVITPIDPLRSQLGVAGDRHIWLNGKTVNDFQPRLTARQEAFEAGKPIPLTLEVTNVGRQDQNYPHGTVTHNDFQLEVFDQFGRSVPYTGGLSQVRERQSTVHPGKTVVIESFDLAQFRYLRKPGTYHAVYCGPYRDRSKPLTFRVTPGSISDGDLVDRLRPLTRDGWKFTASGFQYSISPGSNWKTGDGHVLTFVYNPPATRDDSGIIRLSLTRNAALPQSPEVAIESSAPASEYCGRIPRWHVYMTASKNALQAWPTAREDILNALRRSADEFQHDDAISRLVEWTRFYEVPIESQKSAGFDEQALRKAVAAANLVIVGKIVDQPIRSQVADGVTYYIANVEIRNVLKGDPRFGEGTFLMTIARRETDGLTFEVPMKQDEEGVLFVNFLGVGVKPNFRTADDRSGIRHATPQLLDAIRKLASAQAQGAVTLPVKSSAAQTGENKVRDADLASVLQWSAAVSAKLAKQIRALAPESDRSPAVVEFNAGKLKTLIYEGQKSGSVLTTGYRLTHLEEALGPEAGRGNTFASAGEFQTLSSDGSRRASYSYFLSARVRIRNDHDGTHLSWDDLQALGKASVTDKSFPGGFGRFPLRSEPRSRAVTTSGIRPGQALALLYPFEDDGPDSPRVLLVFEAVRSYETLTTPHNWIRVGAGEKPVRGIAEHNRGKIKDREYRLDLSLDQAGNPNWKHDRTAMVKSWVQTWIRLAEAVDPLWDSEKEVVHMNMAPPDGSYNSGVAASAVRENDIRAWYAAMLAENQLKAERSNTQLRAKRHLASVEHKLQEFMVRAYVQGPAAPMELNEFLAAAPIDQETRARIAATVKAVRTLFPETTISGYGWSDALARVGRNQVPGLIQLAQHELHFSTVRRGAIAALATIGDTRGLKVLTEVMNNVEDDAKVRETARDYLRSLQRKLNSAP